MCTCKQTKQESAPGQKRRRRIWELDEGYLCSIMGTCLSIDELKKLGRKTEIEVAPSLSAYELHLLFVQEVGQACPDSRLVDKKLNRKFQLAIRQAKRIKSADGLVDFWHYSKEQNRLAGAYWAIFTHPLAPPSLCHKIHGEVHMLSHLAGRRSRHDGQRLRDQRNKIEVLQETLQLVRNEAKQEIAWRDEEVAEVRMELAGLGDLQGRLQQALARIAEVESGQELRQLQALNGQQARELNEKSEACTRLTEENNQLGMDHQQLLASQARVQAEYAEVCLENQAMEQVLHRQSSPCPSAGTCECKECPALDLCGRCVLYVGGQHSLISHYRQMVEECGGSFIHHDGGKEDNRAKLGKMLCRADAVICPVNYVSHDACLRAKRLCKSQAKPFIAMRSAGLSSLARGLGQMAVGQAGQENQEIN